MTAGIYFIGLAIAGLLIILIDWLEDPEHKKIQLKWMPVAAVLWPLTLVAVAAAAVLALIIMATVFVQVKVFKNTSV